MELITLSFGITVVACIYPINVLITLYYAVLQSFIYMLPSTPAQQIQDGNSVEFLFFLSQI